MIKRGHAGRQEEMYSVNYLAPKSLYSHGQILAIDQRQSAKTHNKDFTLCRTRTSLYCDVIYINPLHARQIFRNQTLSEKRESKMSTLRLTRNWVLLCVSGIIKITRQASQILWIAD
jgi:hypothetical protein